MRLSRQVSSLYCIVVFVSFGRGQAAEAPRSEEPLPTARTTEIPAYPLVIRIDHSALDPLEAKAIDHRSRVDRVVLGTHAVGESQTLGAISVLMLPDRDDASFDLNFRGRIHASTVGANGPALIFSHTDTDFVCTRQITFDPRRGFVAGVSTIAADTHLVYDGFGSSRGRLGHRLISRVAERRAGESHEEARQIAARDTERELLQVFDQRLNAQLTSMNKSMRLALFVNIFMGKGSAMQLSARSSKDCIYVGFGHEGSPARLTTLPPRRAAPEPIEIAVHSTLLGGQVAKLLSLFKDKTLSPQLSRQEILRTLAIPDEEAAMIVDVDVQDGWFVFGLQNPPPASSPGVTAPLAASESTRE